jgi:hypothetical protein
MFPRLEQLGTDQQLSTKILYLTEVNFLSFRICFVSICFATCLLLEKSDIPCLETFLTPPLIKIQYITYTIHFLLLVCICRRSNCSVR